MKKKFLIVGLIALVACGCGKVSKLKDGSDAVVSFDSSEKISIDNLYGEMKDRYAVSILIDMIDKQLLFKEYKNKIEDAEKNADSYIETLQKNYDTEEELVSAINNYYGYKSIKEFKEYLKLNYFRDLATSDYAEKQITDKQIEEYYKNETVGDIEASHILISVKTTEDMSDKEKTAEEEKAKKKAEDIIKKLNDGEDFAELAKKYSDDDSNKEKNGALGKFNKGDMESSFETAAYALKVDEYTTEPVKTSYGYHIIKKTKEYDKAKLSKVKKDIISTLGKELTSSDKTISITALTEFRKEKGMKIEDTDLQSSYNTYINSLYNYYRTSTTTSSSK